MADKFELKAILSANSEGMVRALKEAGRVAKTTRKYLLDVGNAAGGLASHIGLPLLAAGGLLSAVSIAGIRNAVRNFTELGDRVHKTAQRIGVSTSEYQKLEYMAGQSGIGVEGLTSSMGRLNKNIGEAAAGKNQDLAALLKKLQIPLRDANGQLRAGAVLLPEIAEAFKRNTNEVTRARMGNALFGRAWQELAPLLLGGKEGVDELTDRYKMLGIEVGENSVIAAEKFGDQLDDLHLVSKSYGNLVAEKLLPTLGPLVERMIKWSVANRDLIATKVSAYVGELADSLAKVDWKQVIDGVKNFIDGARSMVDTVGGAKNALILLAIVMNAQTIMATLGLIGATAKLTWWLGTLAVTSLPVAVTALGTLTTSMMTAGTAANFLLGAMAKLALVGAAGYAGWKVGGWINDNLVNPAAEKLSGQKGQTLGGAVYDLFHQEDSAAQRSRPAVAPDVIQSRPPIVAEPPVAPRAPLVSAPGVIQSRPSLIAPPQQVRASGEVTVSFKDAPPGMRVEQVRGTGDVPINTSVGYRSAALGMP